MEMLEQQALQEHKELLGQQEQLELTVQLVL
jgi:hypothetical protein